MFTKRYEFTVESHQVIDFVRLLGRFGLRFTMSDEKYVADELDPDRKFRFRKFVVYAKRKEIDKLYEAVNILAAYHKH